jgi:F-type H+-transporting ATPase subunit a
MILSSLLAFCFLKAGSHNMKVIPTRFQSLVELIYKFVVQTLKQQAGQGAVLYFPLIFLAFIFILFANLIGLLPLGFTTTGHIAVTFTIAFGFNLGFFILGFVKHGIGFLKFFVPSDAPKPLLPLIIVIEVVSYALRTFSLAIRLFANMMAGHTLLFILSSFILAFLHSSYAIFALFPFILVLAVIGLEVGIAFLQAYVFMVLLSIYLNDSLNFSH